MGTTSVGDERDAPRPVEFRRHRPEDAEPTPWWHPTSDRLALWVFVAFVGAAAPLILFHYGSYHWFFRDEFVFLTEDRSSHPPSLFQPYGGAHLTLVPRLVYRVLWALFGMRHYLPYQACVVGMHLSVVILLRVVMRRIGVSAWLATAAASILVLFGPGSQNIVWAFQIAFTGALAFGLAQLVVADHDGPIGRRDALALAFGLLAVLSSGVGVAMTAAVGVAMLIRRGWKAAALQTVPLGLLVLLWAEAYGAGRSGQTETPTPHQLLSWCWSTFTGSFEAIGSSWLLAGVIGVLVVVGFGSALAPARRAQREMRAFALPVGLVAGSAMFALMTGWGRAGAVVGGEPRAARYVYLVAALWLPLIALCLQALVRRWPRVLPVLVVLLLAPIPFNTVGFAGGIFGSPYMQERARILTTAPRLSFADDVPADVEPVIDPFSGQVTIGFLRDALRSGKLRPTRTPVDTSTTNEFRIRLGFEVKRLAPPVGTLSCTTTTSPVEVMVSKGQRITLVGVARIATRSGVSRTSPWVPYRGGTVYDPRVLEVVLPGLDLLVGSAGAQPVTICAPA